MLLLLVVIVVVLVFDYVNGFHDAANAIATVVSTRVLAPRVAVLFAAIFNLVGALSGEAVAKTVGAGLIDTAYVTSLTILAAMLGGIFWNLFTWWFGLPTSSSHALIGGLCGAALASAGGNWHVIKWSLAKVDPHTGAAGWDGLLPKVILPMIASPVAGLIGGYLVMMLLFVIVRNWTPWAVNKTFGKLQLLSASYMAWGHGFADAQKTMGVIALATFAATKAGKLEHLPPMFSFLYSPKFEVHTWIKVACAVVMGLGTWAGGWRIIRTLGHKLITMRPIHGFAAETTGATILLVAGKFGLPVSTTHAITTSIMGVGLAKQRGAFNKVVAERIVWAWIFTIPASGGLAYLFFRGLHLLIIP
ncbi:MAG TPA: inorganic phosphate transporter [Candidatus Udaeobacter sp.]|jgi:PiT family inorganic phosphate transporter|nr:inorganic phosphate transporter [Candidatus Udaeobacter sp.]